MSETALSAMMILSIAIKGLGAPTLILGTGYFFYRRVKNVKPHIERVEEKKRELAEEPS